MAEVKYNQSHHAGATPQERIANRLKPSGMPGQGGMATHGTGPTRTHTFLHESGNVGAHGGPRKEE